MNIEELKNKAEYAWIDCDGCTQDDKQMWINGYLAGALSNQTELSTYDKKETAVGWVIEKLRTLAHNSHTHLGMGDIRITQGYLDEIEEQAKQMEKWQIMDAWDNGDCCIDLPNGDWEQKYKSPEQYYNETYGTQLPS